MSPRHTWRMGRTLLIGSQTGVWRDWTRDNLNGRDSVTLDPALADFGIPGRMALYRDGKPVRWHFVGSLSAQRSPHTVLAGAAQILQVADMDAVVEMFPYRTGPLRLQMARLTAEIVQPKRILIDRRTPIPSSGWPVAPEEVDLVDPLPESVRAGHRKARWLQLLEQCEPHEIDLRKVAVDGLRLGSGIPIPIENLKKFGFAEPLHAESAGASLLVVSEAAVEDVEVSRALDAVHATKAIVIAPKAYDNLLCAFSREDGEDFALGRIVRIRFPEMVAQIEANAVAPAPFATLKVGGLRIDSEGREGIELRPWEA